jgi:hypothetical protein
MSLNQYNDKLNEYLGTTRSLKHVFEVTKLCGYSVFITIYKSQSLFELYQAISHHFGNVPIVSIFYYTPEGERCNVPLSTDTVASFIRTNINNYPAKMVPVYPISSGNMIVYRLYLDDGHTHAHHDDNNNNNNSNNNNSNSNSSSLFRPPLI